MYIWNFNIEKQGFQGHKEYAKELKAAADVPNFRLLNKEFQLKTEMMKDKSVWICLVILLVPVNFM